MTGVAMVDVTLTPTGRPSVTGAAGTTAPTVENRTSLNRASGPAASPRRLHVAYLDANPPHVLERWLCSWSYRYRRALGDSRLVAVRRALACAHSHMELPGC